MDTYYHDHDNNCVIKTWDGLQGEHPLYYLKADVDAVIETLVGERRATQAALEDSEAQRARLREVLEEIVKVAKPNGTDSIWYYTISKVTYDKAKEALG
jgi:hypothetical protein